MGVKYVGSPASNPKDVITLSDLESKFVVDPVDESTYPDGTIFFYTE